MSDAPETRPAAAGGPPLTVIPVRYPPPTRSSPFRWLVRLAVGMVLFFSIAFNFLLLTQIPGCSDSVSSSVEERYYAGQRSATDKIAIVRIDGVLMEGMLSFAKKQIERAAADKHVKAVVVRVNSPGGSITASDDLHRRLVELRDGDRLKHTSGKKLVVSMGSIAASGGYYVAMPARPVFAEPTTITGSIGVYAAFPNVAELGNKVGFKMEVIKAGRVKDSGSPFKEMTPEERHVWEYMVDHAYLQFLEVVEKGRPNLKGKLQETIEIDETLPIRTDKASQKVLKFTRYLADGGIFTAEEARRYGLIDKVGYVDDAVEAAAQAAGLTDDYKVITYEKPLSLVNILSGDAPSELRLDLGRLTEAAVPRLWYLAPQSEVAGLLQAAGLAR